MAPGGGGLVTSSCFPTPAGPRSCVSPTVPQACAPPECPRSVPGVSLEAMEPPVDPGPRRCPLPGPGPGRPWGQPGAAWADVRAAGSAWRESVAAVMESWERLTGEAAELRDACEDAANAEATATTRAGDTQDEATRWGTAGDNLAAIAQPLPVALGREEVALVGAAQEAQGAAATNEAMGEAVVATSRVTAATRRGQWAEVALGPLQRLVDASGRARLFLSELQGWLRAIEATLEGTEEASPNIPEAFVAEVAKFEQLWEASAHLFTCHLLGTLGDIHNLLLSPDGDPGGPGGSGSRAVAKQCQRAREDIPRLLQGQ
ncbi:uncharacterized protein LOC119696615 [Motacilla alba alba]|uniref:uncharacterized protein LOC119696615 n=1 Tax=Motacilla alba alba TaxID=1094192 RepID=UPI0018D4F379|nr:uncharacterized protein LOC119696615 [Motacilla alba alba]